jgi:hypothetical protein
MDLREIAAAVRAHKRVAVVGVLAAITLAFLAHVRVDPFGDPIFSARKPALWTSAITLQLTQEGFYEGRVQDAGRQDALVSLAPLYARLANSDEVRQRMRKLGPVFGGVDIDPLVDENRVALPLVRIRAFALSPARAPVRAVRQANAFRAYLAEQQIANGVAPRSRVQLKVVSGPSPPWVVAPRKITLPVVVFLAMIVVTGALILVLENMRRAKLRPAVATDSRTLEALRGPEEASVAAAARAAESSGTRPRTASGQTVAPMARHAPAAEGARNARDRGEHDRDTAAALPEAANVARGSRHQPRG